MGRYVRPIAIPLPPFGSGRSLPAFRAAEGRELEPVGQRLWQDPHRALAGSRYPWGPHPRSDDALPGPPAEPGGSGKDPGQCMGLADTVGARSAAIKAAMR